MTWAKTETKVSTDEESEENYLGQGECKAELRLTMIHYYHIICSSFNCKYIFSYTSYISFISYHYLIVTLVCTITQPTLFCFIKHVTSTDHRLGTDRRAGVEKT